MLNETPALAPDGQPYRLLTCVTTQGWCSRADRLGCDLLSARIPLSDGSIREALLGCATSRNAIRIRLRFWGPLVVMPTASPIAVIP
ncbi:hypothetical protein ACLK19_05255 [Escherichia coli]